MNETNKKGVKSSWVIGGMTLIGIGVGFFLKEISTDYLVASTLIGI
jgi:hypothetical protein